MSISTWITVALLVLAIVFVPFIPNDTPIECNGADYQTCDEGAGYVSLYYMFFH